jgi:endonuclease/exonuclease/phosphatase family metal-dependent hydrolase
MKFSVLQWNVWYKEDPKKIAKVISNLKPDLIGTQEMIQNIDQEINIDTAKEIAKLTGYNYFYQAGDTWDNKPDRTSQGNAVLTRWPMIQSSFDYVQPPKHDPPDAWHEGRVYVEATVEINGIQMTIGTVHLSFYDHFRITPERKVEIDNLLKIIKARKQHYILTGDLNSNPDDVAVKEIEKYMVNAGPNDNEKTWTTKPFEYQGFIENKLVWRLDYIFTTPDIHILESKVVQTDVSDHLPVMVSMEIG